MAYGASCSGCNFPSPYDVGPTQRGNSFFYLGTTPIHTNGNNLWLKNEISVSSIQAPIDAGLVRYTLSGYFGGDTNKTDAAQLHMFFATSTQQSNGEVIVGDVTPADRQNKTGLLYRQVSGYLPAHTAYINLALQSAQLSGSDQRTGYADNLSLILVPVQVYLPLVAELVDRLPARTGYPAPTGVVAFPNGLTRMDIYWTDNSMNELGFQVQRINANASVDTVCNTPPRWTYCMDPGLSQSSPYGLYLGSNKTYTYQVRAIGPGINSAWANGTGTTATMPSTPPLPTHGGFTCQALGVTSTSATFVWNDPFNYEAGFNLYVGSETSPRWSMHERDTKITLINQVQGSITLTMKPFVLDPANPAYVYESSTSCTATAILPAPPTRVTYFHNNTSYPVISLVVDGWEQFPVRPLSILSGAYYELDGAPAGQHTWTAATGSWDDWGSRFTMYTYSGSFTQPVSGSKDINVADTTIQDLLSVPPSDLGYWEGYAFDAGGNCHTTAFKFQPNGTFTFYNANVVTDSGTYALVARNPAIFSTKFHVTGGKQNADGLLVETQGQFSMNNGPASWPQITYVYKPGGYVRNPFCP